MADCENGSVKIKLETIGGSQKSSVLCCAACAICQKINPFQLPSPVRL